MRVLSVTCSAHGKQPQTFVCGQTVESICASGYLHLPAMGWMNCGHKLADVSAILGSLDIVFGEIDR